MLIGQIASTQSQLVEAKKRLPFPPLATIFFQGRFLSKPALEEK
jgi:hypothetical protein